MDQSLHPCLIFWDHFIGEVVDNDDELEEDENAPAEISYVIEDNNQYGFDFEHELDDDALFDL